MALAEVLLELQRLTERLRRDCPWDREQTERTIVPHTVEEAYEVADLDSELEELRAELDGVEEPAPETPARERHAEEIGDLLFACVNVARRLNADPELELRRASERFVGRVEDAARLAAADGREFASLPLAQQDGYFDQAKEREAT